VVTEAHLTKLKELAKLLTDNPEATYGNNNDFFKYMGLAPRVAKPEKCSTNLRTVMGWLKENPYIDFFSINGISAALYFKTSCIYCRGSNWQLGNIQLSLAMMNKHKVVEDHVTSALKEQKLLHQASIKEYTKEEFDTMVADSMVASRTGYL
jgi:hypothetical protein